MRAWLSSPLGGAARLVLLPFAVACGHTPSPLVPDRAGSVGSPSHGVLTASTELPTHGPGYSWLRQDDHHHALPRFVAAIERAADAVAAERPGCSLRVGDLSTQTGGRLLPHLSHRSGRDADLLFYLTTLDGAPVESPGFLPVGADGLAWDAAGKRFLRFDVEREWLLVRTLLEDPQARIQWVFAHHNVEALLIEHARARGERAELVVRAMDTSDGVTMRNVGQGHPLFGPASTLIRSEALIRIDAEPPLPSGLLVLGQRSSQLLDGRHGSELMMFLGRSIAAIMRRWLID